MSEDQRTLEHEFDSGDSAPTDDGGQGRGSGKPARVLVKLTPKAVATDSTLAEKKATGGETVGFPSKAAAQEALVVNEQVRLQSAKSNADQYDYYLVWQRPPETPPDERDAPEGGWRFQARGNEVGAVAQALLTSVGRRPTPILHYACWDLGVDDDAIRFWQGESLDQFQTVESAHDHSWQPDGVFAVYDEAAWNDLREDDTEVEETKTDGVSSWERMWLKREQHALQRVYPIEVKHDDASFGREQRAAMNELLEHDDDRVVPLLVRVRLDQLPQHYSTRIHTGPFEAD